MFSRQLAVKSRTKLKAGEKKNWIAGPDKTLSGPQRRSRFHITSCEQFQTIGDWLSITLQAFSCQIFRGQRQLLALDFLRLDKIILLAGNAFPKVNHHPILFFTQISHSIFYSNLFPFNVIQSSLCDPSFVIWSDLDTFGRAAEWYSVILLKPTICCPRVCHLAKYFLATMATECWQRVQYKRKRPLNKSRLFHDTKWLIFDISFSI